MADRAGSDVTSTEVIPAGHAALTAKEEVGETGPDLSTGRAALSLAALGVVFGDIGTSPVYTNHPAPLLPRVVLRLGRIATAAAGPPLGRVSGVDYQ